MKKLLYIKVNSKPENESASLQVGRKLIEQLLLRVPDLQVEELNLYDEHIPRLEHLYFCARNSLIDREAMLQLTPKEQQEVERIVQLCDQFIEADVVVLAAPMWSLSFPAPLKEYMDCIVQEGRTIKIEAGKMPKGLLHDKARTVIYVQSSGGKIPWMLSPMYNKGVNYVKDIMKFMGIKKFEELLVDGTGTTSEEKRAAIEKANSQIEDVISQIVLQ